MRLQGSRFTLIAISALFLTPMLVAIMMQSNWWGFEPSRFANRGMLVEPAQNLPLADLEIRYSNQTGFLQDRRQWVMLYAIESDCKEVCLKNIASLRQIHTASGRQRDKVAIWIITAQPLSDETQQDIVAVNPGQDILFDATGQVFETLRSVVLTNGPEGSHHPAGQVFLLDPSTNIILHYPAGFEAKDIDQDLERLLTWSTIK
jgi:hypothetical protein